MKKEEEKWDSKTLLVCSVEMEESKEKKVRMRRAVGMKKKKTRIKKDGNELDYQPLSHLIQLESVDVGDAGSEYQRKGRRRKKEERGALSSTMDFYYYSGFGPLWGKKRGNGAVGNGHGVGVIPPSSSSSSDHDEDHEDGGSRQKYEEDEDVDVIGKMKEKKRAGRRKKVKARSLKSLL